MDKRLNDILGRLVSRRDAGDLTDDDFAYLTRITARDARPADTDAMPLWHWVHARAAAWEAPWFELTASLELGEAADAILSEAGATGAPFETNPARWTARVTREGLKRALRKRLATDTEYDDDPRALAALLVGLGGFDDLAPLLVSGVQATRSGQRAWWDEALQNALKSLTMLDHPSMRELAPFYAKHENSSLRAPSRAWAARHAGSLDEDAVTAMLTPHASGEGGAYANLLGSYPDVALVAIEGGAKVHEALKSALENETVSFRAAFGLGRLAIERKWKDAFKAWLAAGDRDTRGSVALAACWAKAPAWARAAVQERLEPGGEDDEGVQSCLVTAAITLDADPDARIAEFLAHEKPAWRVGAVWACLGRKGGLAKARERLQDDDTDVREAAAAVVIADAQRDAPDALDLVMVPVLNGEWEWRRRLAVRALAAAEVPTSPAVEDYDYSDGVYSPESFERATAFYARNPDWLYRWYASTSIGTVQAMNDVDTARFSLESDLESATDAAEATRIWLELSCVGGPRTASGRLRGALLTTPDTRRVPLDDETFLPALTIALRGESCWRAPAIRALGAMGDRVEPVLANMLHARVDDEVTAAAVRAALELEHPSDALLAEMKTLFTDTEVPITEFKLLRWMELKLDNGHKAQLAARLGDKALPDGLAKNLLTTMASDDAAELSMAGFTALHARYADAPWMHAVIDLRSRSNDWNLRRQAADLMGKHGDDRALPRLLELLTDSDNDVVNSTAAALAGIASRNPALGLAVLDIRDPDQVKTRFGLTEEIDYSKDSREESLRLLLLGLDAKKDAALAKRHRGKKVVVSRVTAESASERGTVTRPMATAEFEALALYLKVDFADDETGSIVADVQKDPSGEVLSALLQTESLVVTSAAWS